MTDFSFLFLFSFFSCLCTSIAYSMLTSRGYPIGNIPLSGFGSVLYMCCILMVLRFFFFLFFYWAGCCDDFFMIVC